MNRLKWNEGDSQISKEYDWDVALGIREHDLEFCRKEHLWIAHRYSLLWVVFKYQCSLTHAQ